MYSGTKPKDVNPLYPDHTYDKIVCLLDGSLKKIISKKYLEKFGYTKEQYCKKFNGAPVSSLAASDNYRKAALSDAGRKQRSATITKLNLENTQFQEKRKSAVREFLNSDRSEEYRKNASNKAKEQHKNGQAEYVKEYFAKRYLGSDDQVKRSIRMKENNPSFNPLCVEKGKATFLKNYANGLVYLSKKVYDDTTLRYQSSYELNFLNYCKNKNVLQLITSPVALKDNIYPRRYYLPDFVFDGRYIVEIKSWYIEKKQLKINPNVTIEKKELVERLGFKWLYIVDLDYTELDLIIASL